MERFSLIFKSKKEFFVGQFALKLAPLTPNESFKSFLVRIEKVLFHLPHSFDHKCSRNFYFRLDTMCPRGSTKLFSSVDFVSRCPLKTSKRLLFSNALAISRATRTRIAANSQHYPTKSRRFIANITSLIVISAEQSNQIKKKKKEKVFPSEGEKHGKSSLSFLLPTKEESLSGKVTRNEINAINLNEL
jgi:hypothetical protein